MEEWGARGLFGNEILTIRRNREVYLVDITSIADGVTSMRIERSVFEELLEKIMEKSNVDKRRVAVRKGKNYQITKEEMRSFEEIKDDDNFITFNSLEDCSKYMNTLREKYKPQERVA